MKDPTKPKWKLGENQYADEYEVVVAPNHQSTAAEWKPRSTRADDLKFRLSNVPANGRSGSLGKSPNRASHG